MSKPKKKFQDDGRTIFSMDALNDDYYLKKNNKNDENHVVLTKKEQKALRKGAFISLLPMLICSVIGFGLVALLIWLWLK